MKEKVKTVSSVVAAPPLPAKLAPWMNHLVSSKARLSDWTAEFGSPLNILATGVMSANLGKLSAPLEERGIRHRLFFARKVNRSLAFLREGVELGLGFDVASVIELHETAQYAPGERIIVTAAAKSRRLIEDSIRFGALIIADNADEIALLADTAQSLAKSARIGIRFAGSPEADSTPYSRFGFAEDECEHVISMIREASCPTAPLQVEILQAHVDRYSPADRAAAARILLRANTRFRDAGFSPKAIDLGGGIVVQYARDAETWNSFCEAMRETVAGRRPMFTHHSDTFGLSTLNGEAVGDLNLYPSYTENCGGRFIESILESTGTGSEPIWKEARAAGLEIYFEPGRALLDGCGVSVGEVRFRKRDTDGNLLIGLAMNRHQLRQFRAEFVVDPIMVAEGPREEIPYGIGAMLVGNSCSESDFLYRRKLAIRHLPEPGDLFVFPNTAPYLMHHFEVGTHGDPLATNLIVDSESLSPLACEEPVMPQRAYRTLSPEGFPAKTLSEGKCTTH